MMSQAQRTAILELSAKGVSQREIAHALHLSRQADSRKEPVCVLPQEVAQVALCDPAIPGFEQSLLFPAAHLSRRHVKER